MLFNSLGYLLFLALAVPLHWALPQRYRIGLLAAASVGFYAMWRWDFALLVVFSAGVDYLAAGRIAASDDPAARRRWLLLSLTVNLGLLVLFKYSYFLWGNAAAALGVLGLGALPELDSVLAGAGVERILLPLGISFYTFQTISYTIDVYRGVARPVGSFLTFLCYVMFWPQLIAGPVLRVGEVVPQLEAERRWSREHLGAGLALIVSGLFKKVVLADSLAPWVDAAFALDPARLSALDVLVMAYLFGFQIYFDFAGYSDVAIGSARLLGIRFPANFAWPYLSRSPREFWTRWHISLSAWIRDYLYLPLTGQRFRTKSTGGLGRAAAGVREDAATENSEPSRATELARSRALLITWFVMGLWHGAAWTFAVWGLYHAVTILLYRVVGPLRRLPESRPALAWALMINLAMLGWIPFRATSLGQVGGIYGRLFDPAAWRLTGQAVDIGAYLWAALILLGMLLAYAVQARQARRPWPQALAEPVTILAYAAMAASVLTCLRAVKQFIYFQF